MLSYPVFNFPCNASHVICLADVQPGLKEQ
jgi:hypothetical protein